jgi:hypothetical protein
MPLSKLFLHLRSIFPPMLPHVHIDFVVPPSWLWPKCNRLLRLGRPLDTVTLPRCCEWWYIWAWGARWGLKPKVYKLPRLRPLWGSSPIMENSHGRTGNRTRDLLSSRQESWPPGHEAGQYPIVRLVIIMDVDVVLFEVRTEAFIHGLI